jgi:hypothetical protein
MAAKARLPPAGPPREASVGDARRKRAAVLELIIVSLTALAGMAVGFWLAIVILSIVTSIVDVPELWLLAYIWLAGMLLLGGAAGAAVGYWIAGSGLALRGGVKVHAALYALVMLFGGFVGWFVGAYLTYGVLWIVSLVIGQIPVAVYPTVIVGAVAGAVAGAVLGHRLATIGRRKRPA